MAAVHEVISASGACLYRGRDLELACEIYEASPAGTRLRCRNEATSPCRTEPAPDEPIPYRLSEVDESVPYALTAAGYAASDMFVVDSADVAELRRRCPELFSRETRTTRAGGPRGRGKSAS
jgi:hypothetical protein